ncbi:lysozyme [Tenacibaculum sp. MAR_2009_124]|uniref:GH25 family lysozyme n=1 Tax=Tenacibaculum sp. MAR_2009_124 TaxID=1250059 RepID=UPI00089B19FC|nr:GH25 family lysozyme [Tenacibaculum sp. MAR_2009_124]SEB37558.1 lysozyme [Tenacibaculum sp. MAR_2009_124]
MRIYYLMCITLSLIMLGSCITKNKKGSTNHNMGVVEKKKEQFVCGIDISHYQGNEIDSMFNDTNNLHFVICKATEGVTIIDPLFNKNWKTIKEHGFLRGAYHFYRSNDSPSDQASFFLKTIGDIQNTDIPPVVDFEEGGIDKTQSVEEVQSSLKTFILAVEKQIECKPIIYTDIVTGNKYLNDSFFSQYPLWIADYVTKKTPDLPNAWKNKGWLIWQKESNYRLDNQNNDFDVFNGSLMDFKEFIRNSYPK